MLGKRQNGVSHVFVHSLQHRSQFLGINAYDKVQEQDKMKASIPLLKEQGYSAPKQLLRILLLVLGPSEMARAISMDEVSS